MVVWRVIVCTHYVFKTCAKQTKNENGKNTKASKIICMNPTAATF